MKHTHTHIYIYIHIYRVITLGKKKSSMLGQAKSSVDPAYD